MILPKAILCFALASTVYSHGPEHNHTADCRKAESLFYSLCSPDPIKLRTIQGLPGVVDYDKVNSTIEQKLKQVLSEQNAKIANFTASLAKAEDERKALEERALEQRQVFSEQNAKIANFTASLAKAEDERKALEERALEQRQALSEQNDKIAKFSASLTKAENERRALEERSSEQRDVLSAQKTKIRELTASLAKAEKERRALEGREGFCFVKYNGKCFWIETNYNGITCQKGREMCVARGGTPADIYSEDHYNMIKEYLRRQIPAGDGYLGLWLGMRFNVRTMTASLSDGTPAPFLKWHPGHPANRAGWECFAISVRVPWNTGNQDMFEYPGTSTNQGVVCQKD